MDFDAILDQAIALLQRRGRLTYRALKMQFALTEEQLDALREELIEGQQVAADEGGKVLVWKGGSVATGQTSSTLASSPAPVSYTPAHLAERIRTTEVTEGERKTITALFADLKGSTALIEGLDPEEARAIIDPALQLMMDAVHRYEGYVAQALGDGIFALFGAPIAHEDHPQRALFAALRMQEEMRRYSDQVRLKHGVPLALRVGVNTGEVVVRSIRKDDLHTDYVPVGHSTNLAARMEQMATPGSILITEYTRKLVEGYFELKALGAAEIKGVEAPLSVYEVLGAGLLRTRLQVAATRRGLTRFIGRQREMEQLQRAWNEAKGGHGQIVGVMGEPGLGKSRLFHEFKLLSHSGCLILDVYSVSHGKATAYLPVIELLKSYFRIESQDDERIRQEKVTGKVLRMDRTLEGTLPYLFALLGIEEQPSPLQQMDPQIRRQRTFEAPKKLFLRESLNQPLILIFEDLHWIDSETQGFLDTLSESVASARILLLTNYRPEYRHEWGQKTYYTQLRLAPFGKAEAEEFLTAVLGDEVETSGRSPLQDLKRLILEKTEGTPFFMEEVVQTLAEEGVLVGDRGRYRLMHHALTLHLPATVQGVLAARIDRLAPDEKALLQQLAILGRVFPLGLIKHVVIQPEAELYRLLSALQHKEFLYEQPAFPEVEYSFKHALTQEVAYGTVLQERRKALHERTAQALETLYTTTLEEHYSDLAHHYSHSSNTAKAVEYLHLAGQQAAQRSAYVEASTHLRTALEFLTTLPDTRERARQELTLQFALGPALMATKGWAAPEVEQAYVRAQDLCRRLGETPQLFYVVMGLSLFYRNRGELQKGYELAGQGLRLAEKVQDPALFIEAHRAVGYSLYWLGELTTARTHVEQSLALYDPQRYRALAVLYGLDPGVVAGSYLSLLMWVLGYPDQARQRSEAAVTLAWELSHTQSLAFALYWAVLLQGYCGEWPSAQGQAEELIALATEQGLLLLSAMGTFAQGWTLTRQGQYEEGIALLRRGITAYRVTGQQLGISWLLSLLAEGYAQTGQLEEGLRVLDEAFAVAHQHGEQAFEAERYRQKGELTFQSKVRGPKSRVEEEAEACFLKAIEIAQRQQAKSLELRAVMNLARLWQQQGKQAEAHQLLSEIYGWFTEGFDTKDLQEAKALLDELAEAR